MAEIVNLRQARKHRRRGEREEKAAANRLIHGTPTAERTKAKALKQRDNKRLDDHHLSLDADADA